MTPGRAAIDKLRGRRSGGGRASPGSSARGPRRAPPVGRGRCRTAGGCADRSPPQTSRTLHGPRRSPGGYGRADPRGRVRVPVVGVEVFHGEGPRPGARGRAVIRRAVSPGSVAARRPQSNRSPPRTNARIQKIRRSEYADGFASLRDPESRPCCDGGRGGRRNFCGLSGLDPRSEFLVPTVPVGMPSSTLCVVFGSGRVVRKRTRERP